MAPEPIKSRVTTAIMRSRQEKQRKFLHRASSAADLQQMQQQRMENATQKTRAQHFIEEIEKNVVKQVEKEWQRKKDIEEE